MGRTRNVANLKVITVPTSDLRSNTCEISYHAAKASTVVVTK